MSNYTPDYKKGAVNPYNFVSLGNGVTRNEPIKGKLTGVIHCSMINATPLAIPDFSNPKKEKVRNENGKIEEHKKVPFFKVNDKPVITGSEIRGVIRSAYETLSNSCLSVNNDNILSARSADIRKPGIIRFESGDNKWHLYKAKAQKLKYDGSEDFDETADTFKRKWKNKKYLKGKAVTRDKVTVNYKFSTNFEEVEVYNLEHSVEDYQEVCKIYIDNDSSLKKYITNPKKDGKCYPVYYLEFTDDDRNYVWLSPAQVSRSVFRHRVDDLLGSYRHCDDTNNVCEACNLFGMIGTKKGCKPSAIASRLRFTDAAVEKESKLFYVTLKELASPHISSVEFYSTAPNMKHQWNYDTRGIKLNGRKYYFHHKGDYSTRVKNGRNITAELIDKGAKFGFDIFFEMLTEDELKKLVWTLTIGENKADGNQMHKIGHGKPIGLGSVKIIVDSVITRSFDPIKTEFTDKELDVDKLIENIPFDENAAYFNEFKSITDFDYLEGKKVAYPYGDDGNDKKTSKGTLTWFKANHNDGKTVNPDEKCNIRYHLPKITDKENLILPALIKDGKSGKERSSGSGERTESSYNVPTSFSGKVTDPNSAKFMCRKCNTWNVVQKSVPFPKPNLPIICKKCGNKFYEKY